MKTPLCRVAIPGARARVRVRARGHIRIHEIVDGLTAIASTVILQFERLIKIGDQSGIGRRRRRHGRIVLANDLTVSPDDVRRCVFDVAIKAVVASNWLAEANPRHAVDFGADGADEILLAAVPFVDLGSRSVARVIIQDSILVSFHARDDYVGAIHCVKAAAT